MSWRVLLSRLALQCAAVARPQARIAFVPEMLADALRVLTHPTAFGSLDGARADRLAALGLRALVFGTTAGAVLGWMTSGIPGPAIASAVNNVLWAAARLSILLVLAPRDRRYRPLTIAVWSVSLLPYLIGVTDGLRLVALAGSWIVCHEALGSSGVRRVTARTMTLWAFGGQIGVSVAGWLLRVGLTLLGMN